MSHSRDTDWLDWEYAELTDAPPKKPPNFRLNLPLTALDSFAVESLLASCSNEIVVHGSGFLLGLVADPLRRFLFSSLWASVASIRLYSPPPSGWRQGEGWYLCQLTRYSPSDDLRAGRSVIWCSLALLELSCWSLSRKIVLMLSSLHIPELCRPWSLRPELWRHSYIFLLR